MPSPREPSWDDLARDLLDLRAAAGNPSYGVLATRVGQLREDRGDPYARPGRSTVFDAFQPGRRRLDVDLVLDLVQVLGGSDDEVDAWRRRCGDVVRHVGSRSSPAVAHLGVAPPSPDFTGRSELIGQILPDEPYDAPASTWAITGIGGVGKSQLASKVAELALARGLVDRVATVDLRSHDPNVSPASPRAALEALLPLLGASVPRHLEARRESFLEALRRERWLLVVENVRDGDEVRLLTAPADGRSTVLLTGREHLGRLEHLDDVRHATVGPLDDQEAVALLRTALGPDGAAGLDPALARDLVATTGRLPLALSLLAGRIAARPEWSPVDHLHHQHERRGLLRLDEPLTDAVRSTYDRLTHSGRLALRRLATQPCPDLDPDSLAALTDLDPDVVRDTVESLAAHHVVETTLRGESVRVGLHDVVRVFAIEAAHVEERPGERTEAFDRLVDHHLSRLWGAGAHLAEVPTSVRPPAGLQVGSMEESQAHAWLADNLDNVLLLATTTTRDDVAGQVGDLVGERLVRLHRFGDLLRVADLEVAAGERTRDPLAVARGQLRQGSALVWQGNPDSAERILRAARVELAGDPDREPAVLNALALALFYAGRLTASLAIFEELTGPEVPLVTRSSALWNSGLLLNDLGHYGRADEVLAEALALAEVDDDPSTIVWAHANLGEALTARGEHEAALARTEQAIGSVVAEAQPLARLHARVVRCTALLALGRDTEAAAELAPLLVHAQAASDRQMERTVRTLLGRAALGLGDPTGSRRHADLALALADDLGGPLGRAAVVVLLGDLAAAEGDPVGAAELWAQAEEHYAEAGAAVVHEVRDRLAVLRADQRSQG